MRHSRCYKKQRQNVKIKREHKGIRYDDLLMLQMVEIFEDDFFFDRCKYTYHMYIYRINLYLLAAVV